MRFCRFCGTKESQFRKSGKFGCVHCVSVFEYPKPNFTKIIPEKQIQTLENFVKENTKSLTLLSLRTRITRNLKSNLFPFYEPSELKSKQLLVENKMESFLYPNGSLSIETRNENPESMMGFYLGSEDHLRFEKILSGKDWKSGNFPSYFESKTRLFRFLLQKEIWANLPELGFISSCPTNLGAGRRDSLLVAVAPEAVYEFFSNLQTLSEFGIEFAPSSDHRFRNIGKDRVLVVKISWKNARVVQKRKFYKILGLLGSY
ncbi:ATP--guanido phosphotransferase [Leptospira congkakensis]|uniref:ATP--guanido phosphotransferase n=1 Tax=Leptospira congkakensis TaxID=2484932 RepID=A0A4Z1AAE3_9LEPT|nr:ATP--guanido phosphotransferase [Leptospira congkakensis]TGL88581.1 ATP--guanido phosphotransferase [Leptospira congkakensis]TGL89167.1 ATP--guanido phosphotransferase [Leptospira congkakensis]TGL97134.1 ATP--guanido phosphotransferase [Leptospira congkakensis]